MKDDDQPVHGWNISSRRSSGADECGTGVFFGSPRPHAPITDAHIREGTNCPIARDVAVATVISLAIPTRIPAVNAPITDAHIRGVTNGAITRDVAVAIAIVISIAHRLDERVCHCPRRDEGCSLRRADEQHRQCD